MKAKILSMMVGLFFLGFSSVHGYSEAVDETGLQALAASGLIELRIYDLINLESDLAKDYSTGYCYGEVTNIEEGYKSKDCLSYQMQDNDDAVIRKFINAIQSGNLQEAKNLWNNGINFSFKEKNDTKIVYPWKVFIDSRMGAVVIFQNGLFTFTNGPHAADMIPTFITISNGKLFQIKYQGTGLGGGKVYELWQSRFWKKLQTAQNNKTGNIHSLFIVKQGIIAFTPYIKGLKQILDKYVK